MGKFNLIDEPWIPCVMLKNNEFKELGLFDTLSRAHEIKEITDNSPLVVVSLHRLLLAILHRNFGPESFDAWKELWKRGQWDAEKLKSYFNEWQDRFFLFDNDRPFYQYREITKAGGQGADYAPVQILMQEKVAGNNATLFDHSFDAISQDTSFAIAARYLVTRQAYSIALGKSYPFYLSDSGLVRGFSVLAFGDNLFQTLALNGLVSRRDKPMPIEEDENGKSLDKPYWERDEADRATESDFVEITEKGKRKRTQRSQIPLGYLDYLTWQSRQIRFVSEGEQIRHCQIQQNFKLGGEDLFDPFKAYSASPNEGWKVRNLNPFKALWRNSDTLFQQFDNVPGRAGKFYRRPLVFNHLAQVSAAIRSGEICGRPLYAFGVFGITTEFGKAASVIYWADERLPLHLGLLNDSELLSKLSYSLNFAEDNGRILKKALWRFAYEILPNVAGKDRRQKALERAESLPSAAAYWSALETPFQILLANLQNDDEVAIRRWFEQVVKTADDAFEVTALSLSGSASEQRAISIAKRWYRMENHTLLHGTKDGRRAGNSIYRSYLSQE